MKIGVFSGFQLTYSTNIEQKGANVTVKFGGGYYIKPPRGGNRIYLIAVGIWTIIFLSKKGEKKLWFS